MKQVLLLLLLLVLVANLQKIYEWGESFDFLLQAEPYELAQLANARAVAASLSSTAVLDKDGNLYVWGQGNVKREPVLVPTPEKMRGLWPELSYFHMVSESGKMYSFGADIFVWNTSCFPSPVKQTIRVAGYANTFMLLENGQLFVTQEFFKMCHDNVQQLGFNGTGTKMAANATHVFVLDLQMNKIHIFNAESIIQTGTLHGEMVAIGAIIQDLAIGFDHELILTSKGLYCRGGNRNGQCGLLRENYGVYIDSFARITSLNIAKVFAGTRAAFVLLSDQKSLMSFGDDSSGQLLSFSLDVADFGSIRMTSPVEAQDFFVSFGERHTIMRIGGKVYTFGKNFVSFVGSLNIKKDGQIGNPALSQSKHEPHELKLSINSVTRIVSGFQHVMLQSGNTIWAYGMYDNFTL